MLNAISLFCSSGIGDLGLKNNNINTVIGCELIEERMQLFIITQMQSVLMEIFGIYKMK